MPLHLRGSNQYYDAESGLHYNHHRYLDVRSGRYLSADPSGLSGGLNLYAFADNNPVANVDPLGLQAKPVVDVSGWDTQQRVEYVLLRAGSQIPGVIGDMLRELVKPESLRTTAIVFGVWAGHNSPRSVRLLTPHSLWLATIFLANTQLLRRRNYSRQRYSHCAQNVKRTCRRRVICWPAV
ncbi:hypothetical protein GCM10022212_02680 [Actimicrobium antarcticum]|uniref:RHS repeat-associated core domain-containing protein n=1 Tax=Actimicrobium antarcticum TaxID=1051899 RepID=A0ABP7SJ84_9BURK